MISIERKFHSAFIYLVWSLCAAVVFDVKNSIKVKVLKNHLVCDILCAPPINIRHGAMRCDVVCKENPIK